MTDLLSTYSQESSVLYTAPLELMTKFLCLVSEQKHSEAFRLCVELLNYEPDNSLLLNYKFALRALIQQVDEEDDDDGDEVDDDDSVYDEETSDDESDATTDVDSVSDSEEYKSGR